MKELSRRLLTAPTSALLAEARARRDGRGPARTSYSRKVFIPLTQLCADVCHYCTFAKAPSRLDAPYLSVEQVLQIAREGAARGCKEALFTLGDAPERRYPAARAALDALGFASTVDYLAHVAGVVLKETGLLPHINAGILGAEDYARLRAVSASMGLMLESASDRLSERGGPHFGSPDKRPAVRLASLAEAGRMGVPVTSGILIGIGETEEERLDTLFALRDLHRAGGHLQEVIVQNFRAKPGTKMADAPEPSDEDLYRTIAWARIILDDDVSVQAPPNLNDGRLTELLDAGIDDWGGISPVTIDHVNPEAPWPHIDRLARVCADAGRPLVERLTVYPRFIQAPDRWLDAKMRAPVLKLADAEGLAREGSWSPGTTLPAPGSPRRPLGAPALARHHGLSEILAKAANATELSEADMVTLFAARDGAAEAVVAAADALRAEVRGDTVTYVINRNINYTNICTYACAFCAFSKTSIKAGTRDKPYVLTGEEVAGRAVEAWAAGATEVCLQGGIHPSYTGDTYADILAAVKRARPDMHVHAFSPLEVSSGAETLGVSVRDYLLRLKDAGLGSLPGTAAEILDDEVRALICPDKLSTQEWLDVVRTAHQVGLPTTATIMFGHLDQPKHWARHLLAIRRLQLETGGFTEFVPLPFVHMEAPLYRRGMARKGPTWRETVLMHAVSRLALHGAIGSIQCSWVKLGLDGAAAMLAAGCNDLGGVLMNESISRAAGAAHGQEVTADDLRATAAAAGRTLRRRSTLYRLYDEEPQLTT
ncbi:5-amino-6-(D-ribitylamino)uracil--L-tyrosine 4-hydroxyphenyl transferase CofH [Sphingomonas naphthae]|uniref:FO synthase n=1 Tax=Sphingomonas naphthae TaxID=1813468 RepID=A0ABY7TK74_9SPHN|nr:5-amino-6-(D-ribitylamino)uracil--L-tyrosine 4-hydroxyphenyl transferase CofH [Sphingomonas naphthae]WCT73610.1 5-amino-6-(D-ribitylamino)uracil--L-tyrosine 4-hydroxyphenyl transferase CofH [Sphingomonas naphthae]